MECIEFAIISRLHVFRSMSQPRKYRLNYQIIDNDIISNRKLISLIKIQNAITQRESE